jgi:hypothetical protein
VETPAEAPPPPDDPHRCPRCGAPHDPYQEYCLECGLRLARYAPATGWAAWRRDVWTHESPVWFWATFLALLLIALVAGAIVLAAEDGEPRRTREARPTTSVLAVPGGGVTTSPLQETITTPGDGDGSTIPTLSTATTRTTTTGTTTTTTTSTTTTGGSSTIVAWPTGRRGYTVILASVPSSQGRSRAEARAREAIADGLPQVGILDSSNFQSLNAGYYVVFTGVYDTEAQVKSAVSRARSAGWSIAYPREVVP